MRKVYVGSTNKNKVQAVKNVFEPNGFEVIGIAVDSEVSSQPKCDEETITGAENRALNLPTDGIRIGLEAGVELLKNELYLTNFGVLITESGKIIRVGGTRIVMPEEIKDAIFKDGLELSDAMDKYFSVKNAKHNNGAIGYFTKDVVKRIDIFDHIAKLLYGSYLYQGEE